jgi:hypothetical protein
MPIEMVPAVIAAPANDEIWVRTVIPIVRAGIRAGVAIVIIRPAVGVTAVRRPGTSGKRQRRGCPGGQQAKAEAGHA